jgi:radical SAM protein with 4Fe4S-binding SPASM domain
VSALGAEAMLSRVEQATGRPLRAMIEISDRCNEACVHCYQVQGRKGEMTTAEVERVLDELAAMGVLVLTISGGEATLRRDFLHIVAHARRRGFAVRVFTNGLTMTRKLAQSLAELAVHVVEVSLYSHRAAAHDFVTGVRGSFERTRAGIAHLVAAGVSVHVKTNLMTVNEGEVEDYVAFVESLGATLAIDAAELLPAEGGSLGPRVWSRSDASYRRMLADPRFGHPWGAPRAAPPLDAPPCGAGESVHVEPNGELRPCTMLELPLGHALADGIAHARAADARFAGLRALRWADVHGCRDCDLRAHCHRCHAAALAEVGDALAPYPSACAEAVLVYERRLGEAPRILPRAGSETRLGPFRACDDGTYEPFADEVTADDDALAARLGWVRRAGASAARAPSRARPGDLVELRRPGRTRTKLERVGGAPAADARETACLGGLR